MHYLISKNAKSSRRISASKPWGLYIVHEGVSASLLGCYRSLKEAKVVSSLLAGRSVKVLVEVA
jgi:hypothetical protein